MYMGEREREREGREEKRIVSWAAAADVTEVSKGNEHISVNTV